MKAMRNHCIGYSAAAVAFYVIFGVVPDNEAAMRSWGVGVWVMVCLAYGFHIAAKESDR